jgi:hypothetical protein
MPFKTVTKAAIIGGGACLALLLAFFLFVEVVPPRSMTATNMWIAKRRIIQYAHQHNHLPANLSDLPPMPGYVTDTHDAWGRPIDYSYDPSGVVTLRSLGSDKKPGGDGDKRDMVGVFPTRDAQGRWEDELASWLHDPLKQ